MEGTRLGPYQLLSELGSGGMGKVYRAEVTGTVPGLETGCTVALKVIHAHLLETPGFFKRFLREADLGRTIEHENVVRTLDCDALLHDGLQQNFLTMEYVEGQTLRELLEELDRVPEELCRHIGREVAKGLAAIHEAGVVHRDLKPENVLITADHVVKIMDLGVARLQAEAIRLSQTGAFVGSLEYAAPEQFKSADVEPDGRADLHALGVVLYELATGQHPYRDEDASRVIGRILNDQPRKAGEVNPQLSPFFEEVVHTLIAKDRDERFPAALELVQVLEDGEKCEWWKERATALRVETKRPLRRIRIPRETALYGRDDDLAKLYALYEKAKDGDGQVLLIEGEAGIGKTRLVDEFVGHLRQAGEDINFLFGSYPPGGAATSAGAFSEAYREQFGDVALEEALSAYLTATPVLIPAYAALLRGETSPKGAEPLTKDSLQTVFVHATRGLAAERTTIVLIDDLHFAPEDGRALFASQAMAVPGHRALLVGTSRPGIAGDWVANLERVVSFARMGLHRLGPKDLLHLLRDSFSSERLADELAGQIAVKSDGNPFFAFEIIRGLREGQFITQSADGTWASTKQIKDIQVPSSVIDLIQARLGNLSEDEKDLLDVASCCGFEFDPLLVAAVVGLGQIPAMKLLARIEKQHRLVRSKGRRFAFDHCQVQGSLYEGMPELLREPYHAAIAQALEKREKAADKDPEDLDGALCVDLAEHYLKGARGESALRYLPPAQAHLSKGYLHAQVVALTEHALAVPNLLTGAERANALLRFVRSLDLTGRRRRQEECAREAEDLAAGTGDQRLREEAAIALGVVLAQTSRHEEAEATFRRALEIALARGDRRGEAVATGSLGNVFHAQGRLDEALEHHERQLAIAREIGDRMLEAVATGCLGNDLSTQGRLDEARAHAERQLAIAREIGDRAGEGLAHGNLGGTFAGLARRAEALEHFERQIAISRELGDRGSEAVGLVNLGPLWLELGDPRRAREALLASHALCREIGAQYPEGFALLGLGRVADDEGDVAGALAFTEESLTLRRRIGHADGAAVSLTALGDLRWRAGDAHGARAALEEAVTLSRRQGRRALDALTLSMLACLPGGYASDALAAFSEHAEQLDSEERMRARFLLWKATGDRTHLAEAKRLLDEALALVPAEHHEAMLTNLRVNREIMEAWAEHGEKA